MLRKWWYIKWLLIVNNLLYILVMYCKMWNKHCKKIQFSFASVSQRSAWPDLTKLNFFNPNGTIRTKNIRNNMKNEIMAIFWWQYLLSLKIKTYLTFSMNIGDLEPFLSKSVICYKIGKIIIMFQWWKNFLQRMISLSPNVNIKMDCNISR